MSKATRILTITAILLMSGSAFAQPPGTIRAIEIQPLANLAFGSFASPVSGGQVTVSPDGIRTVSGVIPVGTSTFNAARFEVRVSDQGNPHYDIILPTSITLNGPSGSMTIVDVRSLPDGTGSAKPPARVETVTVGGTLNIAALQPAGSYTGTFPVTVHLGN